MAMGDGSNRIFVGVRVLAGAGYCSYVRTGCGCWAIMGIEVDKGKDEGAEKFEGPRL
jgi:hypothetical protein